MWKFWCGESRKCKLLDVRLGLLGMIQSHQGMEETHAVKWTCSVSDIRGQNSRAQAPFPVQSSARSVCLSLDNSGREAFTLGLVAHSGQESLSWCRQIRAKHFSTSGWGGQLWITLTSIKKPLCTWLSSPSLRMLSQGSACVVFKALENECHLQVPLATLFMLGHSLSAQLHLCLRCLPVVSGFLFQLSTLFKR